MRMQPDTDPDQLTGLTEVPEYPSTVFMVTFGCKYAREAHPLFPDAHPDGWVVFIASSAAMAREGAIKLFRDHWAFLYTAEQWLEPSVSGKTNEELWPRGELARYVVEASETGGVTVRKV